MQMELAIASSEGFPSLLLRSVTKDLLDAAVDFDKFVSGGSHSLDEGLSVSTGEIRHVVLRLAVAVFLVEGVHIAEWNNLLLDGVQEREDVMRKTYFPKHAYSATCLGSINIAVGISLAEENRRSYSREGLHVRPRVRELLARPYECGVCFS